MDLSLGAFNVVERLSCFEHSGGIGFRALKRKESVM